MHTGSSCQLGDGCTIPDRSTLPGKLYRELDDFVAQLPTREGHLVTVLHKAQQLFGYLPREVQQHVADLMDLSLAKVYGVVSFYTFFTMVPKGRYPISICTGTACYVKQADRIVDAFRDLLGVEIGQVTRDGTFSIDVLRCVGACALAPVLTVGEKVYAHVTPDQVKEIIAEYV
jgi:NADP-reducing hydrogenase subunit HndA